ncbi:MAG: helix-turn-helix transcriptional regulator [Bacteroidia bacterium]|nr:helix-turn-helix transcriptional regulator [Bacteroidia bacterium]
MNRKELGKRIRLLRQAKSLSQENVAGDLGLSLTGYANLETGKTNIPFDRLCQVAAYFKVELSFLLEKKKNYKIPEPDNANAVSESSQNYRAIESDALKKEVLYLKEIIKEKDKIIRLLEKQ